ncbi:MAG TPA: AAA family ATPase [Leptolyngbyaceae cyanobacterium M33_DOE_097]|uniref:Bacterial transcriptional activator domain-containing protein n=1 Tax=Oscillatoriales cyanobacterium SpSt-418 TaxID=2282169 RepID=A0A7C3PGX8_9CYAN|nr:AAA family ATPase [Leptolyngbyaceae cyanobacterium M33_DOE_097]
MSTNLHIRLFGEFCLIANNVPITAVNSERLQALLAFILLHRDTPQARQQIAVKLWPEATDSDAKARLRRRLHDLKQAIPDIDRWLRVETKTIQWVLNKDCGLDVAEFQAGMQLTEQPLATVSAAQIQTLEQAVKLYQGDLLPSCYDDWIVPCREQLRQQAIAGLDTLITHLTTQTSTRAAIAYAQQLQRIDPLYEPAYCHLMRLHAQEGDRASALRVYHQCMTTLQEELGVNPSPTTCKLYEELLTLEDAPPVAECAAVASISGEAIHPQPATSEFLLASHFPRSVSELPLIGRAAEWKAMQEWLTTCRDRVDTEVFCLIGEPGIGKTRLLEELVRTFQQTGGYVLWGRGFEAEMLRPYGIWVDAFEAIGAAEFLDELRSLVLNADSSANLNRGRLFDMAAQFMVQLSQTSPVLVVLDDIQWLDETSIAFLHYVVRLFHQQRPIWFACATRKHEIETNLAAYKLIQVLHREHRIKTVSLAPLDQAQTIALAQAVGCQAGGDQVFANSGGNPLFALEIARTQLPSNRGTPETLETLIQSRLVQLDEGTRDLVLWAAALGRNFNPTILARVMDLPLPRLLGAIEQLEQHGIIRPGNTVNGEASYDFAHDIVRQVAYEQLSEPRRKLVHTHIAQALHAIASPTTQLINDVAHHADLGSDHTLAASASLLAAERCLRVFAYAEAAELTQRGMRHCQYLEAKSRIGLHLGLLKLYVRAGVPKNQVAGLQQELHQLIQEAAALQLKDEEAAGLEALIALSYDHGKLTEVQHYSFRAAEQGRKASPATTMYMLAHSGSCLAEIGREMTRAEALLLEAQSIADRLGLEAIDIPFGLGCVYRYQGQVEAGRSLLRQSWQMAQVAQDHWRECTCLMNLVMLELEAGQLTLALDYCSELIRVSAQMGEGSEAPHAAALDATIHYLLQETNAATELERSCQILKQIDSPRMLAYIQTLAAEWDLHQGDLQRAIARAEEALEAAQVVSNPSEIALAWSVIIQASCQMGNVDCPKQHLTELQKRLKDQPLSARAQQRIVQLAEVAL